MSGSCAGVFRKGVGGIYEVEVCAGASYGGVEPAVEVVPYLFGRYVAEVYDDVVPLAALCFVACDRIGVFHLQGVEVWRPAHLAQAVGVRGVGGDVVGVVVCPLP